MSRGPSPSPMNYHQSPSSASYPLPQPSYTHQPNGSGSLHLSPYAPSSAQPPYPPAQMQSHHPYIPPRSALRVNTEFGAGRIRSNSSALPGPPRSSARPADLAPVYGGMNHQFSRSLSHASPLSPVVTSHSTSPAEGARDGRDVFMAVRNLRGMASDDDPESPVASAQDMGGPSNPSFAHSRSETIGQFSDAQHAETLLDDEDGEEADTLGKLRAALEKSRDGGNTLDVSRRGLQQIGPLAVEIFRKGVGSEHRGVWRLALSYNSLRDNGIDFSFSRLGRLRYLNLKGNSFTVFPLALTEMPALEILDLSKNRLSCFPDRPGRLVNLKVLSLTNNKIVTLPSYLTQFEALKVFKVDGNPIEWPPKEVLGDLVTGETIPGTREREESGGRELKKEEDLRPWIENMKSWMRQREANTDRMLQRSGDDSGYSASDLDSAKPNFAGDASTADTDYSPDSPSSRITSSQTVRPFRYENSIRSASPAPAAAPAPARPARPSLGTRSRSNTISSDNLTRSASPARPPPLQMSNLHTRQRSSTSPPTSAISTSAISISSSLSHSRKSSSNIPLPPPPPISGIIGHNRGASDTATHRLSASLNSKKSLPDLRQSHAKIIQERRESGQEVVEIRSFALGINTPPGATFNAPSPSPLAAKSPTSSTFLSDQEKTRALNRKGSSDMLRRFKSSMAPDSPIGLSMGDKRNSTEGPLVDDSRNSYFRRLSTLPVSSISKAIPSSLLRCIDAIRGILFALSQLHSALRQYLVFAVSDRVANLFSKVMDPASGRMSALINALDRFDSMSRRGTPPVSAIRGVMEATRDSIVTFAKVVAVLRLQMPAVKGTDVRYTRTLLLMIYGSMAEVSYSWTAIAPLIGEIKAMLSDDGQGMAMRAMMGLGGTKMVASASFLGRTPISPIPERGESGSPPSVSRSERTEKALGTSPLHQSVSAVDPSLSPTPSSALGGVMVGRGGGAAAARNRRQAGSFSTQDVQRGMKMGGSASPVADTHGGGGYGRHKSSGSGNSLLPRTEESDAEDEEARMLSALEDEELDTMLPNPPFALRAGVSNSSTSTTKSVPQTPPEHSAPLQPVAMVPTTSQSSRRGHHGPSSSSGSSHALQYPSGHGAGYGIPRKLSVDVRPPTPASAVPVDEDLLDVIESATDVAFTAWLRLAEDIGASSPPTAKGHSKSPSQSSLSSGPYSANDSRRPPTISPKHYSELLDLLSSSEQITSTLRECLMGIRANPSSSQYSHLQNHAQSFVKTVVKVTELVMNISATHAFPSGVKSCCARLVQFTREFAILFSVSNMRPGTSTSMRSLSTVAGGGPMSARSTSPMPFSGRSTTGSSGSGWGGGGGGGLGSRSGSASGFPPLSARSGGMGYNQRETNGTRGYGNGAESSNEDLLVPHSAITPGSGGWNGLATQGQGQGSGQGYGMGMNGPPSAGLRGLQLPSRQAALAKRRAGAGAGAVPVR